MARLCVHDALLVTSEGRREGGVVVGDDGRIEALLAPGERAAAAATIDAAGKPLFAGFIDGHVHMRDPGFPAKETFASGTRAAAIGGVTTVLCMPNSAPPVADLAGLEAARRAAAGMSWVDYGFEAAATPANTNALAELWAAGVVSFEALMSDAPAADRLEAADALARTLEAVAALDALLGVYTGEQAVIDARRAELEAAGRADPMAFVEARPPESEAGGLERLLTAPGAADARLLLRQVCTRGGLERIARARVDAPARRLAVEVTPHHLQLDTDAVRRHGGFALMAPPLRPADDVTAARAALAAGEVDVVGSDHAPHAVDEKDRPRAWDVPGGTPGLDTLAPAVLDLAARGHLDLERVAAVLAERPAELFGLADRKGRLRPGADGDLVLVDLTARRVVTSGDVRSRAARSPFEDTELVGWPVATVLGGTVVARDGEVVGAPCGVWQRRAGAAA